jgi:hypothetical protein
MVTSAPIMVATVKFQYEEGPYIKDFLSRPRCKYGSLLAETPDKITWNTEEQRDSRDGKTITVVAKHGQK